MAFVVYCTLVMIGTIGTILLLCSGAFICILIAKLGVTLRFNTIVIDIATIFYVFMPTKIASTKIYATWIVSGTI